MCRRSIPGKGGSCNRLASHPAADDNGNSGLQAAPGNVPVHRIHTWDRIFQHVEATIPLPGGRHHGPWVDQTDSEFSSRVDSRAVVRLSAVPLHRLRDRAVHHRSTVLAGATRMTFSERGRLSLGLHCQCWVCIGKSVRRLLSGIWPRRFGPIQSRPNVGNQEAMALATSQVRYGRPFATPYEYPPMHPTSAFADPVHLRFLREEM